MSKIGEKKQKLPNSLKPITTSKEHHNQDSQIAKCILIPFIHVVSHYVHRFPPAKNVNRGEGDGLLFSFLRTNSNSGSLWCFFLPSIAYTTVSGGG